MDTAVVEAGSWQPRGGALFATDPLTLWQTQGDPLPVPDTPARVVGLSEAAPNVVGLSQAAPGTYGRTAAMALIWSDAPVVCGEDLGTIAVDTGLAGFLAPDDVTALTTYAETYDGNPYDGSFAQQLDAQAPTPAFLAELPDGTRFPVSGTGWGDGGYPVASLQAADGTVVALYAQFMGGTESWLLPPPCADLTS